MIEYYFFSRFLTLAMQDLLADAKRYIRDAHEFANADAYT
jgi:hypothetical protein